MAPVRVRPGANGFKVDALMMAAFAILAAIVWRLPDFYPILGKIHPGILTEGAAIVLLFSNRDPRRKVRIRGNSVVKIALGLLALMCCSAPVSLYPGYAVSFILLDYSANIILMLTIAIAVRGVLDVERFALAQVIGCAFFCGIILTRFHVDSSGRLGNLAYYDANDFAMLSVCSLPLAIYFARRPGKTLWRILAVAAVGLFMMGIVRSGSRGGFLGLVAVAATLLISFRAVSAGVRVGVVVVLFGVLSLAANDKYWGFVATLIHPKQDYNWAGNSSTGRMEVWKRGMGYMASNPFLGVGPQEFPMAEGRLSPMALEAAARGKTNVAWMAAHNSYVQIAAELGVFGILGFIALLLTALRTLRRISALTHGRDPTQTITPALAQALMATLIGYMVTAFFLSQAYAGLLYSMLGIVVGLAKLYPNANPATRPAPVRVPMRGGLRPVARTNAFVESQRPGNSA